MIISHSRKFVFVHIPKNAGCSFENALIPHLDESDLITDQMNYGKCEELKPSFCKIPHHASLREIQDQSGEGFEKYFKFAVVRNPWDRMVSLFHFYKQLTEPGGQLHGQKRAALAQDRLGGFREWVCSDDLVPNLNLTAESQNAHKSRLQSDWVVDESGKVGVDFVAKFESLHDDFDTICNQVGIHDEKLPWKNASKHSDYKTYFDDETIEVVSRIFDEDLKRFDYQW